MSEEADQKIAKLREEIRKVEREDEKKRKSKEAADKRRAKLRLAANKKAVLAMEQRKATAKSLLGCVKIISQRIARGVANERELDWLNYMNSYLNPPAAKPVAVIDPVVDQGEGDASDDE